jgi:NAD+ kinase
VILERVAVFGSEKNPRTAEVILKLINEFCRKNISVQLYEKSGSQTICPGGLPIEKFSTLDDLTTKPDLVLSVGGDGTFLETMLVVRELGIPVAGINTGRLGFLANISEDEISPALDMLYRGEFEILERRLLEITSPASLFNGSASAALNEITVQKADLNMITITVFVDGIYLNTYWADGIIISTATGSTAYNLSAGGPILSPEDESIIISPISPHNLTIRPIVLSGKSNLKLVVEGRNIEYLATCDFRFTKVPFSKEIHISQPAMKLRTVMLKGSNFYSTLRNKLMWGADRRN